MSIKKSILSASAMALAASLAVGGTYAYFSAENQNLNFMEFDNVSIIQHEYQRAKDENGVFKTATIDEKESYVLEAFEQDKPLYPVAANPGSGEEGSGWDDTIVRMTQVNSYGSMQVFEASNAQDKFVVVQNDGNAPVYVRTIVAIECGDSDGSLIGVANRVVDAEDLEKDPTDTSPWVGNSIGKVEIDGNNYMLSEYIYRGASDVNRHVNGVLPEGETTYPNLTQVYLRAEATGKDCEKIDGNKNGKLDILVVSQAAAIQDYDNAETALDNTFYDVTADDHPWVDGIKVGYQVSNDAELAAAIEAGETEIYLNAGTYHAPAAAKGKTLILNGTKDTILEVVPAGQGEAEGQLDYNFDGSTVTFNGITIQTNSQLYAGYARLSGTYNNCVIQNTYNLGVGDSSFKNCEFNITNEYLRVGGAYSAVFDTCTFNTDGRAILVFQDGTSNDQTVTVKDCTFNATAAAKTWDGIHVAAVSIDGSQGGTYTVNLEGNNTVDSDFNGLWQIKAGEANVTVNE